MWTHLYSAPTSTAKSIQLKVLQIVFSSLFFKKKKLPCWDKYGEQTFMDLEASEFHAKSFMIIFFNIK